MRDDEKSDAARLDAAKAAAPYVHARLASMEINSETKTEHSIEPQSVEQASRNVLELLQKFITSGVGDTKVDSGG